MDQGSFQTNKVSIVSLTKCLKSNIDQFMKEPTSLLKVFIWTVVIAKLQEGFYHIQSRENKTKQNQKKKTNQTKQNKTKTKTKTKALVYISVTCSHLFNTNGEAMALCTLVNCCLAARLLDDFLRRSSNIWQSWYGPLFLFMVVPCFVFVFVFFFLNFVLIASLTHHSVHCMIYYS